MSITTVTTKRMFTLIAAGFLAMTATLLGTSTASADDLNTTSDETVSAIEAEAWPEYAEGDSNVDILTAKFLLAEQGFDPGTESPDFDGDLTEALVEYQVAHDLEDSGALNGETWLLLREQNFGEYGSGSSGNVVEAIQHQLNVKFDAGLDADGLYGPATEEAVREAQEFFEIGVDGIVGELTFRALVTYQDYEG